VEDEYKGKQPSPMVESEDDIVKPNEDTVLPYNLPAPPAKKSFLIEDSQHMEEEFKKPLPEIEPILGKRERKNEVSPPLAPFYRPVEYGGKRLSLKHKPTNNRKTKKHHKVIKKPIKKPTNRRKTAKNIKKKRTKRLNKKINKRKTRRVVPEIENKVLNII